MIDLLLEKYLVGFKKYGHIVDIFENPSKKELREIGKPFRWIADSKRNKVYMWSAMGALHTDAWIQIKKGLNDSRPLHRSSTLITGVTQESGWTLMYAEKAYGPAIRKQMKEFEDWSFTKKYFDISDILKRL